MMFTITSITWVGISSCWHYLPPNESGRSRSLKTMLRCIVFPFKLRLLFQVCIYTYRLAIVTLCKSVFCFVFSLTLLQNIRGLESRIKGQSLLVILYYFFETNVGKSIPLYKTIFSPIVFPRNKWNEIYFYINILCIKVCYVYFNVFYF